MITIDEDFLLEDEEANFDDEENSELVIYQPSFEDYFEEDSTGLDESIVLIEDSQKWEKALDEFKKTNIFGFDLETYGVNTIDPLFFARNKIRLIQVGLPSGKCIIADLGGWLESKEEKTKRLELYSEFLQVLKEKLEDSQVIVLGVNLKFDFTTTRHHFGFVGVQPRDLMIIQQVLLAGVGVEKAKTGENRSERCKISHGLKGIAQRLNIIVDKTQQSSNWGWVLSNKQLNYAARDVVVLFEIFNRLKPEIINQGLTYTAFVECNAVSVFSEIEYMGVPVDLELAQQMLVAYEEKRQFFISQFESLFPGIQWSSNIQVLEAFEELPEFTALFDPGEKHSVGAEVLNKMKHPAADALLQARVLSTAINNIKVYINNSFDGRIRGFYRQIAPGGSGRSTCSAKLSVNRKGYLLGAQLQNPPNAISRFKKELEPVRSIIRAPEGYSFGVFDGAQMHMRIAAELSQDPTLLRIFRDDFDGHSLLAAKLAEMMKLNWTAHFISGVLYKGPRDSNWERDAKVAYQTYLDYLSDDEAALSTEDWINSISGLCKDLRNRGKTVLYASLNGSTAGRITQAMVNDGLKWFTYEHGKQLFDYFKQVYSKLVSYIRDQHNKANAVNADFSHIEDVNGKPLDGSWGRVTTLTGRHIYFKKYPSRFRESQLQVSYTDATAANWLLPEADMIKAWAVEVFLEFRKHPEWDAWIGNIVHDEINVVFREDYGREIAIMIRQKMEEVFGRWLKSIPPVEEADPESFICKSWNEK